MLGLIVLLLVYGVAIEPRLILDEEHETARIPGLPAEWEGKTIAVIADMQIGMWWANEGMVRKAVEEIVKDRPALVLLAGDFLYKPNGEARDQVDDVLELLRPLIASRIPTYAVLGNHDWSLHKKDDPENRRAAIRMRTALESAGIPVLHNQAIPLARNARAAPGAPAPLHLVGIGSEWAEEAEPARALSEVPDGAPRVAFMHNPNSFPKIPAGAAPLAIAAHTHGGQIRIPGLPAWSWLGIVSKGEVHADGWIDGYGAPGNRLYVNRGVGFSTIPVRINCPPELTYITLTGAPATK